ncbi:MAG: hypothetical protein PSX36_03580 [bacterium]|nr:hypothetical protein [bacterium]
MKKQIITLAAGLIIIPGFSQSLQEIITKTDNENFEVAAANYRSLIAKESSKGDNYFYYAENFFKSGDLDSATIYYSKGAEVNATNPLNYVGLGKILLSQTKVNDAKTLFFKAITLGAGKNAELLRKNAEAWLVTENKDADEAIKLATTAIKLDPKNPENYIILGDAQLEKNPTEGSAPVKSYQMASTLNPKSTKGILREGKLYQRGRNYQLALEYYKKAIGIDPNFAPAYREIAELYSLAGQPAKSIENWKKYLEINNSNYARYRFMSALFANKQYSEATSEYESLKKSNFSNLYLERLAGYSYAEMGAKTDTLAYAKGLKAMNTFFEMAGPSFKFIVNDYKYKGLLMAKTGKDSLGIIEMQKAITIDSSSSGEIYSIISGLCMKNKRYDQVIYFQEKKMRGDYKKLVISDCFDLGKACYFSAVACQKQSNEMKESLAKKKKPTNTPEVAAKEAESKNLFQKADLAFIRMGELNPAWPWAYTWRGRVNASLDPMALSDTTKVQYEKVLSLIKPEERTGIYKPSVIEAYEYLGYYYVTKKEDAKAKEQWLIVKELDPTNEKANNYLNPKKPQPTAPKPPGTK